MTRSPALPFFLSFSSPKKGGPVSFPSVFSCFFFRGSHIVSPGSAASCCVVLCCVVCCLVEPNRVRRPRLHVDQAVSNTRGDSRPIPKASGTTNVTRLERGYENQEQTEERLVRKEREKHGKVGTCAGNATRRYHETCPEQKRSECARRTRETKTMEPSTIQGLLGIKPNGGTDVSSVAWNQRHRHLLKSAKTERI